MSDHLRDTIKQIAEAEILRWYDTDSVGLDNAASTIADRARAEMLLRVWPAVETAAVETLEVNGTPSAGDSDEIRFLARRIADRAVRAVAGSASHLSGVDREAAGWAAVFIRERASHGELDGIGGAALALLDRMLGSSGDGGEPRSRQPQGPRETQQGAATPEHGATAQGAGQALGNVAEPQSGPTAHRVGHPPSPISPPADIIDLAIHAAGQSTCRSRRGVVIYLPTTGTILGRGHNGPPREMGCPGREHCAGNCGLRSVHAETRALRHASRVVAPPPAIADLVHVERNVFGPGIVAHDGPSCPTCAREILDAGIIAGVWLYLGVSRCHACRRFEDSSEKAEDRLRRCSACGADLTPSGVWRRYTAEEFYRETLRRCGLSLP